MIGHVKRKGLPPVDFRKKFQASDTFRLLRHIPFLLTMVGLFATLYDFGFNQPEYLQKHINQCYIFLMVIECLILALRYFYFQRKKSFKVKVFDVFLGLLLIMSLLVALNVLNYPFFSSQLGLSILFLTMFIRELSAEQIEFKQRYINPAQLFMFSFMAVILAGTYALMFPNATTHGISFIDALFTSASAVCVTGLAVVDTGLAFTTLGQTTIMILMQLGGLGIMTFTSYFSFFFTGQSSYENQLLIQKMTSSDKISDVFSTLKRVILLTFVIEAIGVLFIFFSLNAEIMPGLGDRIFFSMFHSVSGFCNAGFSTLTYNFYELGYRFNYPLHLTVAFLIIIGGIGFPIMFNFAKYLKHLFKHRLFKKNHIHSPWIININTRIVLVTTMLLLVVGTALIYAFEYNNTLAEHGPFGKLVTAFFSAVTPRTAGFSSVDYSRIHMSTILLLYVLMWIGASPASTGGGIKTSTLAISVLNAIGLARGKDRIECFGREISDSSIRRAYAQIFFSIFAIMVSVFLVSYYDPSLDLKSIVFECISAFGTVGLSLGITAKLSFASKLVITLTMFIGRVSLLTILASFLKQVKFMKYKYPSEDLTIN
ncbi:MAG TPA: potassium transporter TrkG [Bacteroidales bacterium]|nr:potassium transporter TrkG [Bacteroidales bacterium]